jgi:hypothetical protein
MSFNIEDAEWMRLEPDDRALVKRKLEEDPAFSEVIAALKGLPAPQRTFMACFSRAHFDPVMARKLYKRLTGRVLSGRKLAQWMEDPAFKGAVAKTEELAARAVGVSPANVLSSLADIRRRNLGKDDRTAMIALELIGKHLRMWRSAEDQQAGGKQLPAFVVSVNIATPEPRPAVDVAFHEVKNSE